MPLFRVTTRFLSLATGFESTTTQEIEAPDEATAAERAGLRGSRGHGRLVPRDTIAVVPVEPGPRKPAKGARRS